MIPSTHQASYSPGWMILTANGNPCCHSSRLDSWTKIKFRSHTIHAVDSKADNIQGLQWDTTAPLSDHINCAQYTVITTVFLAPSMTLCFDSERFSFLKQIQTSLTHAVNKSITCEGKGNNHFYVSKALWNAVESHWHLWNRIHRLVTWCFLLLWCLRDFQLVLNNRQSQLRLKHLDER